MKEVKKQHKMIRRKNEHQDNEDSQPKEKVYELNEAPKFASNIKNITRVSKSSLGDRLAREAFSTVVAGTGGNREMKFSMRRNKTDSENHKKMQKHYQERKQIVRRTGFLSKKKMPKM